MPKEFIRRALDRAGYHIAAHGYTAHLVLRDTLKQVLKDVEVVYDVGANTGQYGTYLREVIGYRGRIVSFEPNPADYEACRAIADDRWEVHNIALGERNETLKLNVMAASDLNSFYAPAPSRYDKNVVVETIDVPVRRLDEVVPPTANAYLKCDTQGHDLAVFRGASGIMDGVKGIQTELSAKPIYAGIPSMTEALDELLPYGFDIACLVPVSTTTDGKVIEFDCVMIR